MTGLPNDESLNSYLLSNAILEVISNSTIDTLGHKIEIIADAGIIVLKQTFEILRKINEESLKPETGLSVNFKTKSFGDNYSNIVLLPSKYSKSWPCVKCEYIGIMLPAVRQNMVEILSTYLPTLLGLTLRFNGILSCNFLSAFKNLEQHQ